MSHKNQYINWTLVTFSSVSSSNSIVNFDTCVIKLPAQMKKQYFLALSYLIWSILSFCYWSMSCISSSSDSESFSLKNKLWNMLQSRPSFLSVASSFSDTLGSFDYLSISSEPSFIYISMWSFLKVSIIGFTSEWVKKLFYSRSR